MRVPPHKEFQINLRVFFAGRFHLLLLSSHPTQHNNSPPLRVTTLKHGTHRNNNIMTIDVDGAVAEHHILRHQTQRRVAVRHEDEEEEGVDIGSFRDVAVDFVAGCVSGCAGIVVGQVCGHQRVTRRNTALLWILWLKGSRVCRSLLQADRDFLWPLQTLVEQRYNSTSIDLRLFFEQQVLLRNKSAEEINVYDFVF